MSKPTIINPPPPVAQRPKCGNCNEPLAPRMNSDTVREPIPPTTNPSGDVAYGGGGFHHRIVSKTWDGTYHAYGNFCTLRCCEAFANAMYKRGVRR